MHNVGKLLEYCSPLFLPRFPLPPRVSSMNFTKNDEIERENINHGEARIKFWLEVRNN